MAIVFLMVRCLSFVRICSRARIASQHCFGKGSLGGSFWGAGNGADGGWPSRLLRLSTAPAGRRRKMKKQPGWARTYAGLEWIADSEVKYEIVSTPVAVADIDVLEYPAVARCPVGDP
jgi:hypothetical protein